MASKQNRWYIGVEGLWKEAEQVFVFTDGQWNECRLKMVADPDSEYWREAFNNEADGVSEGFDITSLSDRGLFAGNGNLYMYGPKMIDITPPDPADYAFYSLRGTKVDLFEDFGDLTLYGDTAIYYVMNYGILSAFSEPGKHQYIQFPLGSSGYDYKGLVGNTGNTYFEVTMKHKPLFLPTGNDIAVVFQAGVPGRRVAIYYDSAGTLYGSYEFLGNACLVSIVNAMAENEWTGFALQQNSGYLTLTLDDGSNNTSSLSVLYDYNPPIDMPMYLLKGDQYSYIASTDFFMSITTHPDITIDTGTLGIYMLNNNYRSAMAGDDMPPGTGKYYIEILVSSYDSHIGLVRPSDCSLTNLAAAVGVWGWAVNTINGRKFNHQTGGGTTWSTAIANGSIVGILYDSDLGCFDLYVNGVIRTRPFAAGSITDTVRFAIGGRGLVSSSIPMDHDVRLTAGTWAYDPAPSPPSPPVPFSLVPGSTTTVYTPGLYRDVVVRNAAMNNLMDVIKIDPTVQYFLQNLTTMAITNFSDWIVSAGETQAVATIPQSLEPGNYELYAEHFVEGESARRFFTVYPSVAETESLSVDFSNISLYQLNKKFLAAHKAWGGANGGVVTECLTLDTVNGLLRVQACGDNYTGDILGVDRLGQPSGFNTRIGGCIVTRGYYGPGSYRCVVKFPDFIGVCSAFWTFHYEEGYPVHPVYNSIKADGIVDQGNLESGFYNVRNHEIDIELPVALVPPLDEGVSYQNVWFNSWRGELETEYVNNPVNHGITLNDGYFHEMRFDWHLGEDPRVEWYIDNVLYLTCRDFVPDIPGRFWAGLWFPSSSVKWAGPDASWETQEMLIKSISITPFLNEYGDCREIGETYPNVGYRPIRKVIM